MLYEVVVCEKNSLSEGQIIYYGTLEDCCKYAENESEKTSLALMVKPKITSYIFVNGQKQNVR